ncbi:MAG: PilZ domain-containing protein [Planctomycetota bacterium]|nr:MAG: PilZ domain-containing protein [Planctomycetota bacterium]
MSVAARQTEPLIEPAAGRTDPSPLRFERRAFERRPAIGTLDAVRCDGLAPPAAIALRLLDESEGGIAATADEPLPPGARLRVRTCPVAGAWREGVVVRCRPNGAGYAVALAYTARRAA